MSTSGLFTQPGKTADNPEGWIFPSPRTASGHMVTMLQPFRRCAKAAGLDPHRATPHAMRHTAVTRFSAAVGGDAATVQRFSGHQSLAMLLRYTHPADERVNDALDSMGGDSVLPMQKAESA